jgi:glycine/D-amino acid oxidase-like deaminating enzyme/nitrite reductase/ring-hydroxylating ferredoxin subunit
MDTRSTGTRSPWIHEAIPSDGPLLHDAHADVCIIGAGMVGISIAQELSDRGRSVIVLDRAEIGGGETGRTTAHLVTAPDRPYAEIEQLHGRDAAAQVARSHAAAIDRVERLIREHSIDCSFTRLDGYLGLPPDLEADADRHLDRELAAAGRAGLEAERCERCLFSPSLKGPLIRIPNQAQFHPLRYLAGLAEDLRHSGGRVHTGTHATSIRGGQSASITTQSGWHVNAQAVVVATHTPINDLVAVHTKQAAYRTYAVALRIPPGSFVPGLYWDGPWSDHPAFHYARLATSSPDGDHDVLIVGGEDHKTGQADDNDMRHSRLERWAREHFPAATEVLYRWSGQIMVPHDGLAFIGRNPLDADNVYVVTGDCGNGMTYAAIAAMIIPDLIEGRDHEWARMYSPSRINVRAASEFARETVNYVAQYKDWVLPAEVHSGEEIKPGAGAILRRGLRRVAVYRDESGTLTERSAVCPHLGCVVHWNPGECTWDCPCHGSRFDREGHVIHGPANRDLGPADEPTRHAHPPIPTEAAEPAPRVV